MQPKDLRRILVLCVVIALFLLRSGKHALPPMPALAIDKEITSHWQFAATIVLWLIYSIYWEIAKFGASAAITSESSFSRGIHVLLGNVAALMVLAPIHGMGRFLPLAPWIMTIGTAIAALGVGIAIFARIHLGRHWSGEITIKKDHELIRTGPYKSLRHPIYTGILTMYLGTTFVTGTWLALLGLVLACIAYYRKIRLEEANLAVAFGASYDAYRQTSKALIPGIF
jgi:protein-S-isoprenylcysteine O-methyltransferase Ste14